MGKIGILSQITLPPLTAKLTAIPGNKPLHKVAKTDRYSLLQKSVKECEWGWEWVRASHKPNSVPVGLAAAQAAIIYLGHRLPNASSNQPES